MDLKKGLNWAINKTNNNNKIINKVIKVSYRLDLPLKIKIHLVYYIAILKPVYRNYKSLIYE